MLGVIFRKAQNKIQDPAKLKRLIADLIDQENWSATGVDIKGDAYEGLLAKGAEDLKSGAGQYFTPRALISAMVDCASSRPWPTPWSIRPAEPAASCWPPTSTPPRDAEDFTPDEKAHIYAKGSCTASNWLTAPPVWQR